MTRRQDERRHVFECEIIGRAKLSANDGFRHRQFRPAAPDPRALPVKNLPMIRDG
jgi:hypothetical protein